MNTLTAQSLIRRPTGWLTAVLITLTACLATGCNMVSNSAKPEPKSTASTFVIEAATDEPAGADGVGHEAVTEFHAVRIRPMVAGKPPADYRIGPLDRLYVNVYGQPDMGSPVMPGGGGQIVGTRVDGSGRIQLPMVGSIHVAGSTGTQIQARLQKEFGKFISEPWVVVEVIEHRSQPIYLVGQFRQPGMVFLDRPTNVVQAVALGRGIEERSNLRAGRILRDDQIIPVDLYDVLRRGALDQNIWLQGGDTIYVPDNFDQHVYVLGEVESPGQISMTHSRLTLDQAIAKAGGFKTTGSTIDKVRIIRSLSTTRGALITVDLKKILGGESLPYHLEPGDVVYIPKSRLGEWNDTLRELLPTLQTISALMQPFVQLVVLTRNNDD